MTAIASTDRIERRFGDLVAVDGVSLVVEPGEIVGLLGANGAGKTTVIKILLGLLPPTFGRVFLFGRAVDRAARRRVGYLPQDAGLYDELTVAENLDFAARVFGCPPPDLGSLQTVSDRVVASLSLGFKRRVGFAAATVHSPEFLVLDEPTSGVDPAARTELWDDIHAAAERGTGVLVTTHHMDEAEQCDRLILMAAGREIASGSVADITAGIVTSVIDADHLTVAAARLEAAGFPVLPAGGSLRLAGIEPERVGDVLDGEYTVSESPATLEEAFIVLSAP